MTASIPIAPHDTQAPPRQTLAVALFDDHAASRAGYTHLLAADDVAVMVAEPLDAVRAEERLAEIGPMDAALISTGDRDGSGLAFARKFARLAKGTPMLLLADTCEDFDLAAVLANGAAGIVCRRCATDRIARALRSVAAGGISAECPVAPALPRGDALSARERMIVSEFARGSSTEEVAEQLWVSPHTVRTHMKNIQRKLDARTRTHAVAIALALGEVSLDPPAG